MLKYWGRSHWLALCVISKTVAGVMGKSNWLVIVWAVFSKGRRWINFSMLVWQMAFMPNMPSGGHSAGLTVSVVLQLGHLY